MSLKVNVQKHAPERRKKSATTLHCGCTCCCCCCLHTLGGVVAAAVAPAIGKNSPVPLTYYYDEEIGQDVPLINKPGLSSVTFFWWLLAFLTFLCFVYGLLLDASGWSFLATAIVVLLAFPGLQMLSAVISLIVYAFWPRLDKMRQITHLGKITLGVVVGSGVGILAMVGIAFLFGAFR